MFGKAKLFMGDSLSEVKAPGREETTITEARVEKVDTPTIKAQLNKFIVYNELTVEYNLSPRYCVEIFLEKGEVLSTEAQVLRVTQEDIQHKFSREGREALLWIWAEYGNRSLCLPDQHQQLELHSLQATLVNFAREIQRHKTQELQRVYHWLRNWQYDGTREQLFGYIGYLSEQKALVQSYGCDTVQQLFEQRETQLRQDYVAERERWILREGSDYLKYLLQGGYDLELVYVKERAAREFPGFQPVGEGNYAQLHPKALPSPEEVDISRRFNSLVVEDEQGKTYLLIQHFLGQYDIMAPVETVVGKP